MAAALLLSVKSGPEKKHVNAKLSGQVKKGVTNFRDMPQGYSMKS
jgi:hypothetical protein